MIKKIFVPILKIFKRKFIKIEDPRFANREAEQIGTKLVSSWDRMPDASKEKAMAEEHHQQIMTQRDSEGRRRYVSEQTVPTEEEIRGPSESKPEESNENK